MPSLYEKLKKEMNAVGMKPRTALARSWLVNKIAQLKIPTNRSSLLNDPKRATGFAIVGKMFFYRYDPKYKDTLPVWDRYPLVLPMDLYGDGFLGLNLHYLDPYSRLYLLDLLHDFINNEKYNDSTRFKLSYQVLNASKRYKMIEPCIKRYLYTHIVSSMIYIEPDSWETAIFLPTERFYYNR
jgi:hypothetical protein